MNKENPQNDSVPAENQAQAKGDRKPSDHTALIIPVALTAEAQSGETPAQTAPEKVVIASINEDLPHNLRTHHRPQHHWRDRDEAFKPHHFQQRIQALKPQTAKVLITPQAYKEMLLYVEIGQKEVGWLGTVTKQEDGNYLIDKTFLLEQEVTSAETELSAEDIGKMTEALLDQGDEGFEQANRLRFWGHSHVRMGTSPSGTDENTMKHRQEEGFEWYIRGIFNKLGRAEFTIYDFELGYAVCDAPWMVIEPETGRNLTPRGGNIFGGFPRFPGYRVVEEESFFGLGQHHPLGSTGKDWRERNLANAQMHENLHQDTQSTRYPNLAPELIPDEALREQVKAEFAVKVTERSYGMRMGKWFQGDQGHLLAVDVQHDFSLEGQPQEHNRHLPPSEIGLNAWPQDAEEGAPISAQSHWPDHATQNDFPQTNPEPPANRDYTPPDRTRMRTHYIKHQPHWLVRLFKFILGHN